MTAIEYVTLILSLLSGLVGLTALITFLSNRRAKSRDEGAKSAIVNASLDTIKLQNESIMLGNRNICDKLDNQNVRLAKLEQTVADSRLCEIPTRLATIEAGVKSAHHRLDGLEKNTGG